MEILIAIIIGLFTALGVVVAGAFVYLVIAVWRSREAEIRDLDRRDPT